MKELYIQATEDAVTEYLEEHPEASESEAYDAVTENSGNPAGLSPVDIKYQGHIDRLVDAADNLRKRRREEGY